MPGQGRIDKGFDRIFKILLFLRKIDDNFNFKFNLQNLDKFDSNYNYRYLNIIKNTEEIELFSENLSQEKINQIYLSSDIIILPYDKDTYMYRGSAVFQEAISIGIPVIVSDETGNSDLVQKYKNGFIASSNLDFAKKIIEISNIKKEKIKKILDRARKIYENDFTRSINKII